MKHPLFPLCAASVLAVFLLTGCEATDVFYEVPSETTTSAVEDEETVQPTATPQPASTAEPTPAADLNKTYTLEELSQNNTLRTLLQQYGTVGVDGSNDGDPQWEITKTHCQYLMDENGYLQVNYLVGDSPMSSVSSYFLLQDDPGYAYQVSFNNSQGERFLTFCDPSVLDLMLDQPWYGPELVFEIPADPVIIDTHSENGQILVTVAYIPQGGTDRSNTRTYYIDPVTDLVMRVETVSTGSLGGEILDERHSVDTLTLSPEFEDWSAQIQGVTDAAGGLQVTFRISTTSMNTIVERQMSLTPYTYLSVRAGTSTLGFMSDDSLGDDTGLRYHPTVDGQVIGVFGGP